jgi:hypothetical protein
MTTSGHKMRNTRPVTPATYKGFFETRIPSTNGWLFGVSDNLHIEVRACYCQMSNWARPIGVPRRSHVHDCKNKATATIKQHENSHLNLASNNLWWSNKHHASQWQTSDGFHQHGVIQFCRTSCTTILQVTMNPKKSAVFWGITRGRVVIVYRRFGKTYRSDPHGSRVTQEFSTNFAYFFPL